MASRKGWVYQSRGIRTLGIMSAAGETPIKLQHSLVFFCVLRLLRLGRLVSFQVTVLKVLAGHPGGRASLDELRRAVMILMSSGTDWTARTKAMAARAPDLNLFGAITGSAGR